MVNRSKPLRIIMLLVWVVILGLAMGAVSVGAVMRSDDAVTISILEESAERIAVRYEFGDFRRRGISINGQTFTGIHLGGESLKKEKGAPALPDVSRSIIIPDDARMEVRVLDSSYYEIGNIDVVPSKGYILRTVNSADVPYTFGKAYETDSFYPGPLSTLREPYIMRDHRGIVVTANPFQYNPVKRVLRVYNYMTVEVAAVGAGEVNVLKRDGRERALVRPFHDIYSSHFLNYSTYGLEDKRFDPNVEEGEMLIIAYDSWISNVQPLVNHKNNIGINTTVVGVSTIGNDPNLIKAYIQNVYDTNDLAFVLLVGDINEVNSPRVSTTYYENVLSDPTYSKLAGDNNYPDIIVGRFSAQTAAQVDTQVERTIEYENMPATLQAWFWQGTGIGSAELLGSEPIEYDCEHIDNIRDDLLAYSYTDVDQIYEDRSDMEVYVPKGLNAGRGIVNYCGHGAQFSWHWGSWENPKSEFTNDDVHALTNENMLPFIFDVACVNGEFDYEQHPWDGYPYPECFAEAWMRAIHEGEPTGAVGIYASSIMQSYDPPMCAQDESIDLFVSESYYSFGALCFAGSCRMMEQYPPWHILGSGVDMFNTWHIFGDPSLRVVGTVKASPPVAHNGSISTQTDMGVKITLRALDDGQPDPPGVLSYIITSLPSHGTLSDPQAGTISSVPYTLVSNGKEVIFTPNAGYTGLDSFRFKANDGGTPPDGGYSNEATISVAIFENIDVAPGGWWKFDEGTGSMAYDASGNGYDGTILGAAWTSPGSDEMGWCLHFDGDDDYVSISPIPALAGNRVTLSAWIKPGVYCDLYDSRDRYFPIVTQCYKELGNYYGYRLRLHRPVGDRPRPEFYLNNDVVSSSQEIDVCEWHHLAGTYDNSNLRIYVDGVLEGTYSASGQNGVSCDAYIGYPVEKILLPPSPYFDGEIDDVRVYNQPLALDQIWEIMFNDTSKFSVKDGSGERVAWFDNLGNLFLAEKLYQESSHPPTGHDEFRVQDSEGNDVAIIDTTDGKMYIKGTLKLDSQGNWVAPTDGDDNFRIKDRSGNDVAYISKTGDLYLNGGLYEQNP